MKDWAKIARFLQGKSVAIIGGHKVERVAAEILDSYDVLVWTNNHWLRRRGRIGGLFHCCGPLAPAKALLAEFPEPDFFVGAGWAVGAPAFREYCSERGIPALFYDHTIDSNPLYLPLLMQCQKFGASEPLTGLIAANFMHMMPVKSIGLLGMNLYLGQEWPATVKAHNPIAHARLFKRLIDIDGRFVPYAELDSAMGYLLHSAGLAARNS